MMQAKCMAVAAMAAGLMVGASATSATITHLSDDFTSYWRNTTNGTSGGTYSNGYSNEALRAAWNNSAVVVYSDSAWDASAVPLVMSNNNQITYRQFATPVLASSDWSVSLRMLNTTYGTSGSVQKVWLANYDSANSTIAAYGLLWNTGAATSYDSEGQAQVRSLATTAISSFSINTTGSNLSSTQSGHFGADGNDTSNDALDLPMATWELKWSAATGTLSLFVDGEPKGTAILDSSTSAKTPVASSFNRLYIVGSNSGRFDDVVVTSTPIPEPTTGAAAIAAVMAAGMAMRRVRVK